MEHPPPSSSSEYSDENTPGAAAPSKSQKYLKSVESDFCSEFSFSLSLSLNRWLSEINVFQPHACLNLTRKFCSKHDACRKIVIGEGLFYVNWFFGFHSSEDFFRGHQFPLRCWRFIVFLSWDKKVLYSIALDRKESNLTCNFLHKIYDRIP